MTIRAERYVNRAGRKGIRAGRKTVRAGCSTLSNMPSWSTERTINACNYKFASARPQLRRRSCDYWLAASTGGRVRVAHPDPPRSPAPRLPAHAARGEARHPQHRRQGERPPPVVLRCDYIFVRFSFTYAVCPSVRLSPSLSTPHWRLSPPSGVRPSVRPSVRLTVRVL